MKPIDHFLNRITMYRLMLYYLIALVAIAAGLCALGRIQFNALGMVFTAGYLTIICWLANRLLAYIFEAPTNIESVYITALILTLIITPYKTPHDIVFLTIVCVLAMASKFVLAINKKHIFNPTAVAVALTAAVAGRAASWWVGNNYMLPFVVVGGLLVVRKIERGRMVTSFLVAAAVSTVVVNLITRHSIIANLRATAFDSSLFFLAFVMLTEPMTSPPTKDKQTWYAAIAGLLFPPQIRLFAIYSTPELSLLVANVYSYIVSPKRKFMPKLSQKTTLAPDIMDFVFKPEHPVKFKPGQYMEWTLPHNGADSRGNRRYFTLASSPTENNIRLGVKFYNDGSSYKRAMLAMNSSSRVAAGQLSGDCVMPGDKSQKLAFIAGGIGITPYRSMFKYLLDMDERRDITMLYSEKSAGQFVYTKVFDAAERRLGAKIVYTITSSKSAPVSWRGATGNISAQMIKAEVPDYKDRLFYISGPNSMVRAVKDILRGLGVAHHNIKTDFFPGYV